MLVSVKAFTPYTASTVNIAATTTTGRVALPAESTNDENVLVVNPSTNLAFVELGDATVNAVITTSLPILPGTGIVIARKNASHMAGIMAAGTATLYATLGSGT